jgi:hypothetical protein
MIFPTLDLSNEDTAARRKKILALSETKPIVKGKHFFYFFPPPKPFFVTNNSA